MSTVDKIELTQQEYDALLTFKKTYVDEFKAGFAKDTRDFDDVEAEKAVNRALSTHFFNNNKFVPPRFTKYILEAYPERSFITPMNDQGGDVINMYHPLTGIYRDNGIPIVEQDAARILGERMKPGMYTAIVKQLKVETYTKPEDFEEPPHIVVLKNGAFNILTGELTSFSPYYNARSQLPIIYDPDADCVLFKRFLLEVIPDEVEFMQEWFGYHLLKEYRFQRCVVLHGDGDNGKTTLINVIEAWLGPENIESKSLYELTSDKFAKADLFGKLANLSRDIGHEELKHSGVIKTLTGNDMISAQRKNRDPFQFRNFAKLTLACNQVPTTKDESLAFFKRFIVVVFDKIIPQEKQDPLLTSKLTTPDELSGIFNWAHEGLQRAIQRGYLVETRDTVEKKEFYLAMSDPVRGFFNENINEDYNSFETKQDVLNAFYEHCRGKHFVSPSDRRFYEDFKNLANINNYNPKLYSVDHPKGKQTACYKGIKLVYDRHRSEYFNNKKEFIEKTGGQTGL